MHGKILKGIYRNINTGEIAGGFIYFLVFSYLFCNFSYCNFPFWGRGAQFDENEFFHTFGSSINILFLKFFALNFTVTLSHMVSF